MFITFLDQLYQYTEALLDLIYPHHIKCNLCNSYLNHGGKYGFCHGCLKNMAFITKNSCYQCGRPLTNEEDTRICRDCEDMEYFFHRAVAVVEYKGIFRDLIFRFKYKDATYLARDLGDMMAAVIKKEGLWGDVLVAVPLHRQREKQRGYNQSHLLAKHISRNLRIPYKKDLLLRVKNTKVMHNLSREERQENLKGAFQIRDRRGIDGKSILLIDDIFTTGATLNACSKVLMEGGAKSVAVVAFARGV